MWAFSSVDENSNGINYMSEEEHNVGKVRVMNVITLKVIAKLGFH